MRPLVPAARLFFGAWMLLHGLNHFFLGLYALPAGHDPRAAQLMTALVDSGMLDLVLGIQLVAGALILADLFVPAALCVLMPISTCALYFALILDRQALDGALTLAAFALNGLLMLAYLDQYRGVLRRHALAIGERRAEI